MFKDNVTIQASEFEIGNFGTIYDYCFFPGPGRLRIGHNFWIGTSSLVDSLGEPRSATTSAWARTASCGRI